MNKARPDSLIRRASPGPVVVGHLPGSMAFSGYPRLWGQQVDGIPLRPISRLNNP